ncbi:hypothetical protein BpHYR1_024445 [Brachionus plicatilis]|uniref:Uncharacterized protein n=1 Tax=Brachionus plicatilis TaxID=10195 RepID=A0A3M7SAS5_BRAPC|nr:hypothetical protein BpHYR1_024445 [Brachionus plicatilis]
MDTEQYRKKLDRRQESPSTASISNGTKLATTVYFCYYSWNRKKIIAIKINIIDYSKILILYEFNNTVVLEKCFFLGYLKFLI